MRTWQRDVLPAVASSDLQLLCSSSNWQEVQLGPQGFVPNPEVSLGHRSPPLLFLPLPALLGHLLGTIPRAPL